MRDYLTLHLDTTECNGTAVLHFTVIVGSSKMRITHTLK